MPLLYKLSQLNRTFRDGRKDTSNVKGIHANFTPENNVDSATGHRLCT